MDPVDDMIGALIGGLVLLMIVAMVGSMALIAAPVILLVYAIGTTDFFGDVLLPLGVVLFLGYCAFVAITTPDSSGAEGPSSTQSVTQPARRAINHTYREVPESVPASAPRGSTTSSVGRSRFHREIAWDYENVSDGTFPVWDGDREYVADLRKLVHGVDDWCLHYRPINDPCEETLPDVDALFPVNGNTRIAWLHAQEGRDVAIACIVGDWPGCVVASISGTGHPVLLPGSYRSTADVVVGVAWGRICPHGVPGAPDMHLGDLGESLVRLEIHCIGSDVYVAANMRRGVLYAHGVDPMTIDW